MPDAILTYIYPAWGLIPTKEMAAKSRAVHVQVAFAEDSPSPVTIVHNLQLAYGAPLQPPQWVPPLVVVNPIAAGVVPVPHVLTLLDGNTLQLSRSGAGGPGSAVTYDVWIFGHPRSEGFFASLMS